MGELCWCDKTLFRCICSYCKRSWRCPNFTNTRWHKLLPRKMFPHFFQFLAFWIFELRKIGKHFEAVSFIALHLEFLSFLLMIPTSTRDATIDFIDDITNRVSERFNNLWPTEINEFSLTQNFGISTQPIASWLLMSFGILDLNSSDFSLRPSFSKFKHKLSKRYID